MISQNDLYDIAYAFCIIRNDIKCEFCGRVLLEIERVLKREGGFEENQIRKAIASIENLDKERWGFVYHINVYVNCKLLKDTHIYDVMIKICRELFELFKANEYEKFNDLIDCVHCLPEIIADNKFSIPNEYWTNYIKPYRNKWNNCFLLQEQKCLKRGRLFRRCVGL